jgi:hypothetical protein
LSLSGRAGLVINKKTGVAYREAGEKGFDAEVEEDVVTAEIWIKILDKN